MFPFFLFRCELQERVALFVLLTLLSRVPVLFTNSGPLENAKSVFVDIFVQKCLHEGPCPRGLSSSSRVSLG